MTLPTGTVAFLFSDIEGSTRRWERHGEAMRDALRRHDRILRMEIEARRGYIFKTIGDAFCAAFWNVPDALGAAVEAQRRFEREDFRAVDGLHVRMAIHAGATDERDGDYFGVAVNRTARLLSAGNGGQILLSAFASRLAAPELPGGVSLRSLGALPLRDLKEPEHVYQAIAEGLRSESKPLRALETPPNNLPRQSTSFVGRHDDIAQVEALLEEGALVTIVGAGGIGKTRLALEVAKNLVNDEPNGAWLVDLSAVGDPSLIAGTILSAVGGERSAEGDALDDLIVFLERREMLLVLDNSEHLVAEVAAIVARIVARCPHTRILVTSRSPLDISGERIYRLGTLEIDSAVQLFNDRAQAANRAFDPRQKATIVKGICERLDGVALALELAAARVRTMSVEDLSSRLELRLLAGGRDRRPRQQTMRALIDWSYDLLSNEEQDALRRCAVFVRGFSLAVAERVAGPDEREHPIFDLLASLVDKSLVLNDTEGGEGRYRMLEPIREYAWEKLTQAEELAETRRRHAEAFAALADAWYREWDIGPASDWIARLDRDLANLRAALRWSVEEGNDPVLGARLVADSTIVFLRLALLTEGIDWCRRILQAGLSLEAEVEARLRYGLSMLYSNLGDFAQCFDEALIAVPRYRKARDVRGLARALSQVASRYALKEQYELARTAAEESLQLARASGDGRLLADVLRRCATSFTGEGQDVVRTHFEESAAIFRSLGRDDDTARALIWWSEAEMRSGNYGLALTTLEEAARLDAGDAVMMMICNEIASVSLAIDDVTRAEPFARKSLLLAAKAKDTVVAALAISYLAAVEGERDVRKAARLIGHAQAKLQKAKWELVHPDDAVIGALHRRLVGELSEDERTKLLREGAAWTEDQAVHSALAH